MKAHNSGMVRAIGLVGPTGTGKTTLAQSLLNAARSNGGAGVQRPDGPSQELTFAALDFLGDRLLLLDAPGSADFSAEFDCVAPALDLAIVVADPDPERAHLLQPHLRELERRGVPRAIFVNKIDTAQAGAADLLQALQPFSRLPLVARQLPLWEDGQAKGYIDLALERAFIYREGQASERVAIPEGMAALEGDARFHMLEQLADFDDALLEQLLGDEPPAPDAIFDDLIRELQEGLIAPVFFGAALHGFGMRRLLKALRHETPAPALAAARLGLSGAGAYVMKIMHSGQAGKLAYARVFNASLTDGDELISPDGATVRASGLSSPQANAPGAMQKISAAAPGEIIALAKVDSPHAGDILAGGGDAAHIDLPDRPPVYDLAIAARDRKDDMRLSIALGKLVEEDRGLTVAQNAETHETLLRGQGETHLRASLERLKRRFGVDASFGTPRTPYKETIRKPITQRGRHKKQTGGHGQFGDVLIEIKPLERGAGFAFIDRITGGAVPKQWIPAVEQGVRDALEKGPMGFAVVDVAVTLVDGAFHSVDSSEQAFRSAGRIAMTEGLTSGDPYLLEPIEKLTIYSPSSATPRINSAITSRHGQILGFEPREGWTGWDRIDAYMPHAEQQNFIIELRSLTQGMGTFAAQRSHLVELTGRRARDIAQNQRVSA